MKWLRELRHMFCIAAHGVSLDNYRDVYMLGELVGLECRHCGILRT